MLTILPADNPLLRRRSKKVKTIDGAIQRLIDDMIDTMRAAPGVGLAAPQVGVPLRAIVIEPPEEELIVLINPEIIKVTGEREVEEGCLCLPGYMATIKRSITVKAKGLTRQGKEVRIKGEGILAQALEHEVDHLNGVLFIDHLDSLDKLRRVERRAREPEKEPSLA